MININGYYLNDKYTDVVALIRDMMNTATLARTKLEAKTLLRLLRYLGANYIMYDTPMSDLEMNIPSRGLKNYLYQIQLYQGKLIVLGTPLSVWNSALIISPVMTLRDIIVKKSLLASVRDLF